MYDPKLDQLDSGIFIKSFDVKNIQESLDCIYCPIHARGCCFQVIFKDSSVDVDPFVIEKARDALENLHNLNWLAKENTPEDDNYTLCVVYVSPDELELHYVYDLANASHGVFFEKNTEGIWVFEDWG